MRLFLDDYSWLNVRLISRWYTRYEQTRKVPRRARLNVIWYSLFDISSNYLNGYFESRVFKHEFEWYFSKNSRYRKRRMLGGLLGGTGVRKGVWRKKKKTSANSSLSIRDASYFLFSRPRLYIFWLRRRCARSKDKLDAARERESPSNLRYVRWWEREMDARVEVFTRSFKFVKVLVLIIV